MTHGHREAQRLFIEIGKARRYRTTRSYSVSLPTDGVWWTPIQIAGEDRVPAAALEVAATESPKTWRGSLAVLEEVSPGIGFLVLQEEVVRRRLVKKGSSPEAAEAEIERILAAMRRAASVRNTRIRVMTVAQLRYEHRLATMK